MRTPLRARLPILLVLAVTLTPAAGPVAAAAPAPVASIASTGPPLAGPGPRQPPPTPPVPPGGDVAARAAQVGGLVSRLSSLQARLEDLQDQVGRRQEVANRSLADDTAAAARADAARRAAADTRARADAAAVAAENARRQVDEWVAAWYQQADAGSALSMLAGSTSPADVMARARLRDAVTAERVDALEGFERARVDAANADSAARAARAEADASAARAARARAGAEAELAAARTATDEQTRRIGEVRAQRDAVEADLRALEASDAGLAAQRRRAEAFGAETERRAQASDAAAREAATARLAAARPSAPDGGPAPRIDPDPPDTPDPAAPDEPDGPEEPETPTEPAEDPVRTVIDRALSQLGTVYAWGGGDADGPTRGIRDGGVADSFGDFDKVGFDCSGLMIYAFAGVGKDLPHYSGYQSTAGRQVPLEERRPGDMLFWGDEDGVHHVALYLGDDEMVEAPESGKVVRVSSVRFDDEILPTVTRLLE